MHPAVGDGGRHRPHANGSSGGRETLEFVVRLLITRGPRASPTLLLKGSFILDDSDFWPFIISIVAASGILGGTLLVFADAGQQAPRLTKTEAVAEPENRKKKVVVLGTGWAAISFLKSLNSTVYDVQVVSPRNFFVFTPLLPSVTVGTVEARSITESIRKIMRKKKNVEYCQATCVHIDSLNKKVLCRPVVGCPEAVKGDFELAYDYLVVAVGAEPNTFNTPGVEQHCHFLKDVEDAEKIRESIVDCFELADLPIVTEDERRRLLHFVTVGGGPTGVEFAAELHDLVYEDLYKLYPQLIDYVNIVLIQSGDHILNMFDVRISEFAEEKFQRDGIDVKTGCRVLEVQEKAIVMKDKSTGKRIEVPYGMVVWSTGIGTRPLIIQFMKQIGQGDRRLLATDEWLRVKGCENAYALGDCATIEQRKLLEDISYIFTLADKDKNGTLSIQEFKEAMEAIRSRYPQIDLYLKRQHMKDVVRILDHSKGDQKEKQHMKDVVRILDHSKGDRKGKQHIEIEIEKFKEALSKVDAQMKALPATAQVAAQQGEYLAWCFNHWEKCAAHPEGPLRVRGEGRHQFPPFVYKHFGQFAPLGGERTAAELPGDWISIGRSTQWLWYSVYASKQVSWRTRALVVFDWTKRCLFGRDTSRM
ncbi:hypothetical protein GOP47_0022405 [Adiantum capillus-veneris]|uniref:NADH:ubiquinone reductase (non-electrogenic) n=1 Tax=Adiantum capillus-veneris TaxID=13818 RepID=A0A9D4U5B8_ADICA|nr:hypothetical protein GOP47_0022405 [Adiantum capillus-veneris]